MSKIEDAKVTITKRSNIKKPRTTNIRPSDGTKVIKIDGGSLD